MRKVRPAGESGNEYERKECLRLPDPRTHRPRRARALTRRWADGVPFRGAAGMAASCRRREAPAVAVPAFPRHLASQAGRWSLCPSQN